MTATLSDVRKALSDTIRQADIGVYTYAQVRDKGHLPAVIIEPVESDFHLAFNRGSDTWDFNLFVLVRGADEDAAQRKLDKYVSGHGPNSIREIVANNKGLGLPEGSVEATVYKLSAYGGEFKWNNNEHIGAILRARVLINKT